MKRTATLIYGVIISTVIFLLSSCTNEMSIDWTKAVMFSTPHYLNVSQTMLSFSEGEGGTHSLKVTATGTSWELKDLPEWLTADKLSGTEDATIAITCTPNPSSTEARAAIIYIHSTVTGWDYSIPVSVSQSRCKAYANPASTSVTFDGSEGVQTLSVTSNVADWKVTSSQEWLTAEKGADGKSVTLTVKANTGKASRRAYVTLKTTDTESQITVDQRPGNISATLDKMTFTHEDSTQMVTITSDASWTVQTSSSWIEVLPSSGDAGTTEVSVRASANNSFDPRTGFVYFVMTDNNKVELPVEQGAVTFSLSETALDFDRNGGKKSIVVETNTEWTLMSDLPDWLTLSATEGTGTTEVTFSVKENGSISSRKATVRFRPKKIGTFFEVKVTQSEQTFRMDVPTLQFTNEGGSFLLSFEATGAWTATASVDWITVSPTSGTGSATCTVTVEPNEGDNRSGEVVLTSYDLTYRIPVTQQAPYLTLSTEGLQFDSKGGTLNVDVSTNLPWSASVKDNAAWLSVSPTAGEQSGKMGITASDNPTLESRDGKVEVVSQGLPNLFVAVSQAARYLTLSTEAIDFVAKGGESERITIDTDGEFTISTESDWITINKTSEKSFILTVTENSTSEERRGMVVVFMTDLTSGELARIIAVTQRSMYGTVNGHAYVDLGLPSGALWATMNVGASSPDDFGDYFAWGETEPKESYDLTNYKWCKIVGYNRYETTKYSSLDDKQILESEDDAATVNWGEQWHTPSGTEWTELFNNCTRIWTSQNGVEGLKLTSNLNENSIFFPAAGKSDTSYSGSGCYWHNSIIYYAWDGHDGYSFASYELMNQNGEKEEIFDNYISFRYQGLSIRPVYQPNYLKLSSKELSLPPAGGNESVILETNLSWTASTDVSWIHLSANSGSGNMTLTITIDENNTFDRRTGTVSISSTSFGLSDSIIVKQGRYINPNGHEYVDLGLPSGLLWATMNLGAIAPEEVGDLFAWGETATKETYDWGNYKWCNGIHNWLTKYNSDESYGPVDKKNQLEPSDDAATVNWGGSWRLPTADDCWELLQYCWIDTIGGGNDWGMFIPPTAAIATSKINGNKLFFPLFNGDYGVYPSYWSSSCGIGFSKAEEFLNHDNRPETAWSLVFYGAWNETLLGLDRYNPSFVRPVIAP